MGKIVNCGSCGVEFTPRAGASAGRFCSVKCGYAGRVGRLLVTAGDDEEVDNHVVDALPASLIDDALAEAIDEELPTLLHPWPGNVPAPVDAPMLLVADSRQHMRYERARLRGWARLDPPLWDYEQGPRTIFEAHYPGEDVSER